MLLASRMGTPDGKGSEFPHSECPKRVDSNCHFIPNKSKFKQPPKLIVNFFLIKKTGCR